MDPKIKISLGQAFRITNGGRAQHLEINGHKIPNHDIGKTILGNAFTTGKPAPFQPCESRSGFMNVLIVYWHPEPRSFNGALFRTACETLTEQGHAVRTSDLHEMRFDPVSGRHNFASVADPGFFKQQTEELHATEKEGFSAEVEICTSSVSASWNPTSCLDPRI
jgi:hypothetical protein